jgi:hypothetical protein
MQRLYLRDGKLFTVDDDAVPAAAPAVASHRPPGRRR